MTKLHLDPNAPRTNFILGAALSGGDVTKAAELADGCRLIAIGVTPHRLIREEAPEACSVTVWDGRQVELRENRGGWRFTGLSGTCERLSEDGKHMVLAVEYDPDSYWPTGTLLLVELDHETRPAYQRYS